MSVAERGPRELEIAGTIEPEAVPLDQKIAQGFALKSLVDARQALAVSWRLDEAFEQMRADSTTEYGTCIAWGTDLITQDEEAIDTTLLATAERQNHGMLTQYILGGQDMLWQGYDDPKRYNLQKIVVPLVMSDQSVVSGIVYSLLSRRY